MTTGPVTRGPYRNGVRRRAQIVDKASEVFGELGYAGGSLRTIAERVGVSPASLLQFFGSKEGLLEAVLEDWTRRTEAQYQGPELRGLASWRAFHGLMEFHLENRGLLELFLTMAAEATNPQHPAREFIRARYATGLARLARALAEAREAGEIGPLTDAQIEAEASMFYAMLDGLELQWLLDSRVDLVGLFDQYLDDAITRWQSGLARSAPSPPTGAA